MPWPIARYRIRTLLALIAVIAVTLSAVIQTTQRARHCRERARFHAGQSASFKQTALIESYKVRLLQSDVLFIGSNKFTESVLQASGGVDVKGTPEEKREIAENVKREMIAETEKEVDRLMVSEREHRALAARHAELRQQFERATWRPWIRLPNEPVESADLGGAAPGG